MRYATDPGAWTGAQCADAWRIKESTWRGYVKRNQAPRPLTGFDEQGRRRWDPDLVRNYQRPGQGRRPGHRAGPSDEQREQLQALTNDAETPAAVARNARIVLWHAEGRPIKEVAALAEVSNYTVHVCVKRYQDDGIAGLYHLWTGREHHPTETPGEDDIATTRSP